MKGYYTADGDQLPLSTLRMRKEEMGLCVDRGISMRCKELPPCVALTARPGQGAEALLLRDAGPPLWSSACPFGAARPGQGTSGSGERPCPCVRSPALTLGVRLCAPDLPPRLAPNPAVSPAPRSDSLSLGPVSGLEGAVEPVCVKVTYLKRRSVKRPRVPEGTGGCGGYLFSLRFNGGL